MILLSTDPSGIYLFFRAVWYWFLVVSLLLFVIGFALRWLETHQASHGHFMIGLIAVCSSAVYLIVLGFAKEFAWLFAPFAILFTACWLFYNNWYFMGYPKYKEWLADPTVRPNTFGMDTKLAQLLINKGQTGASWGGFGFKVAIGAFVFAFLVGFGFVRHANEIANGDKRVENATRQAGKNTAAVVDKAVATAVSKEVAPLKKGQQEIKAYATQAVLVASQSNEAAKGRFKILDQKADVAAKSALRAAQEAARVRRSPVVPVAPIQAKSTITPTISTDKVRNLPNTPAEQRRRFPGKNQTTSYVDEPDSKKTDTYEANSEKTDTTAYVRREP